MDVNELIFACEVRKLAIEHRNEQWHEDKRPYDKALPAEQKDALDAWSAHFPISHFIPGAYQEIVSVAKQIRGLAIAEETSGKSFWEQASLKS